MAESSLIPTYSADCYDAALIKLRAYGPELKNHLSNHMPMVAEALCHLGQPEAVLPWVLPRLETAQSRPERQAPITLQNWQDHLGQADRWADWADFFETEIETHGWRETLNRWAEPLAPGLIGQATHGLLRAAHAAAALNSEDTPARRDEFADGMAYWASGYMALPAGMLAPDEAPLPLAEAFASIPIVPIAERRNEGAITTAVTVLASRNDFAPVINRLKIGVNLENTALDMAEALVPVFLEQARDILSTIVFTHTLTSLQAIMRLMPLVDKNTANTLLRHGWQAAAALVACYVESGLADRETPETERETDIVARAIEHGDDHVIKLSATCLAFHKKRANEGFLQIPALARQYL